jgi:hypothetical protein
MQQITNHISVKASTTILLASCTYPAPSQAIQLCKPAPQLHFAALSIGARGVLKLVAEKAYGLRSVLRAICKD